MDQELTFKPGDILTFRDKANSILLEVDHAKLINGVEFVMCCNHERPKDGYQLYPASDLVLRHRPDGRHEYPPFLHIDLLQHSSGILKP